MIDHLGGSDRRHPDRAVWRTLPAKIFPVCGTGGRCGNQRNEASNRLPCPGCLPFAGVAANMCSSQKAGRKSQGRYGNAESGAEVCPPPTPFGVFVFYRCVCPHVFFAKNWQENQGAMRKYRNQERKAVRCLPCPRCSLLQAYLSHAVLRTKNPPAGKPGDFYQAFAVRWVFSRAITTGGISTS